MRCGLSCQWEEWCRLSMSILRGLIVFVLGASVYVQQAAAAVPLEGEWRGKGTVQITKGAQENLSCRVKYSPQSSGVYDFHAVCASASVRIIQTGVVSKATDTSYLGTGHNAEWDVSGRVRIEINGQKQTVTVTASQGSGRLTLRKR